jgi:hypothetical protein
MNTNIRRTAVLAATLVLVSSPLIGHVGRAVAAPYGVTTLTISVSAPDPCPGQRILVRVSGAVASDSIAISVDSIPAVVATFVADVTGTASGVIVVPQGTVGAHEVMAKTGGATASAAIRVQDPTARSGCVATSTPLASTGTDVAGIGALSLSLLVAGTLLVSFARRRDHRAVPHRHAAI